jgi:hypothetical protein
MNIIQNNIDKTGGDFDGFCDKLFGFWFGTYSRCKQKHRIGGFWHQNEDEPLGSSGWPFSQYSILNFWNLKVLSMFSAGNGVKE